VRQLIILATLSSVVAGCITAGGVDIRPPNLALIHTGAEAIFVDRYRLERVSSYVFATVYIVGPKDHIIDGQPYPLRRRRLQLDCERRFLLEDRLDHIAADGQVRLGDSVGAPAMTWPHAPPATQDDAGILAQLCKRFPGGGSGIGSDFAEAVRVGRQHLSEGGS